EDRHAVISAPAFASCSDREATSFKQKSAQEATAERCMARSHRLKDDMKDSTPGSRFDKPQSKRVTDWRPLVGLDVQIWRGNKIVDQGLVEAVTDDGNVLWLKQQGAINRRLVMKEAGTGLRVRLITLAQSVGACPGLAPFPAIRRRPKLNRTSYPTHAEPPHRSEVAP